MPRSDRLPPIRSWLYVPGNRPDRIAKALGLGADAVIIDLEDAVPEGEKERARREAASAIDARAGHRAPALFVRVNALGSAAAPADIAAVVRAGLTGLRFPKCEDAASVSAACALVAAAETAAGLPSGSIAVVPGIESARGLADAAQIASADPRVLALAFGAADFARDLGLEPGPDGTETLYARSALVVASRVAGIRPPIESVQTDIADLERLSRSTRAARALGFFGRSVIHPTQIAVVNDVFTPNAAEIARAREIVEAADRGSANGRGAVRSGDELVDAAIVKRAQDTLWLAQELAGARS
jgi:citrate lyase subunit beta / citryl-CoA lyase